MHTMSLTFLSCDLHCLMHVQETRWLEYMRSQLSHTHGGIGESVQAADKLLTEHLKFLETAKVHRDLP